MNKENHDRVCVWISDLSIDFYDFISLCSRSQVLGSIEKMYETLEIVFDDISKHLKVCQKSSAASRIFNSILGVWKCVQTQSFVFDRQREKTRIQFEFFQ